MGWLGQQTIVAEPHADVPCGDSSHLLNDNRIKQALASNKGDPGRVKCSQLMPEDGSKPVAAK